MAGSFKGTFLDYCIDLQRYWKVFYKQLDGVM
jgi:hypothetical protein